MSMLNKHVDDVFCGAPVISRDTRQIFKAQLRSIDCDKYAWNINSRKAAPEELQIRTKEENSLRLPFPADTLCKVYLIIVLIEIEYIAFVFELIQFSLEEFCQSVEQHILSSFE